jgi:protease htpX homolog
MQNASEQSAHMFIVNPFGSLTSKLGVLFRTHPSTSDRIAELQRLEQDIKRGM